MMTFFYPKIALNSIKVNKKLYLPYILTSSLWVMMFYIIFSLASSEQIKASEGGTSITMILQMGIPFIFIFSSLFLFYTNSFLSKMRRKEYALYNILGMNKQNIAYVLLWDSMITSITSLALGLTAGVLFYKLFELMLLQITKDDITYTYSISATNILISCIAFGVIFVAIYVFSLIRIKLKSPIELLKSQTTGEKPPRANVILGVLGVICLAIAYYISITAVNPMAAISQFFLAVMLVVLGTYLLFIAGSVLLCKILQNNKKYYYQTTHFISISSMAYRMKRTGAGLAAICIFSTMVLVMLSSTFSLYIGSEDMLEKRYPKDINTLYTSDIPLVMQDDFVKDAILYTDETIKEYGGTISDILVYNRLATAGQVQDGYLETDYTNAISIDTIYQIFFYDIKTYNENLGQSYTLDENEIYVHSPRGEFAERSLKIVDKTFNIKGTLDLFWSDEVSAMTIFPTLMIVVEDLAIIEELFGEVLNQEGYSMISSQFSYNVNTGLSSDDQIAISEIISGNFVTELGHHTHINSFSIESLAGNRLGFYGLFGGLLFIGGVLSFLFISATVLIIYYKQIVEGYEDKKRFEIMQKVGMTQDEIKKTINTQVLTVFFLPLIMAGIHLAFAFPIIRLFLLMFNLTSISLFVAIAIVSFIVFAIMYSIVYKLTSKIYFNIVS